MKGEGEGVSEYDRQRVCMGNVVTVVWEISKGVCLKTTPRSEREKKERFIR